MQLLAKFKQNSVHGVQSHLKIFENAPLKCQITLRVDISFCVNIYNLMVNGVIVMLQMTQKLF